MLCFPRKLGFHPVLRRRSVFIPAHQWIPSSQRKASALVLHGLMGHKSNWLQFFNQYTRRNEGIRTLLVDLRNHGDSSLKECPGPHTLEACGQDIVRLCVTLDIRPDFIIGHSFGGKVAWKAAEFLHHIDRGPKQVLVMDESVLGWVAE
eukprot:TRINITY_DN1670_c0_g1_i19.p1 TRINITY_DN1670_c0_g1~~TRINITY_DN1670_c0_g1_i19.p1  ORF type:complete len:149 (-),score=25.85 TRINITY_DN1670_c0_g1_i19:737-1183(-)